MAIKKTPKGATADEAVTSADEIAVEEAAEAEAPEPVVIAAPTEEREPVDAVCEACGGRGIVISNAHPTMGSGWPQCGKCGGRGLVRV